MTKASSSATWSWGSRCSATRSSRALDLTGEPFPNELLLRLKHMIVSHHGTHEFGSPKLPMTLEAIALHYLDNLDAKIHTFSREIRDDPCRESSWTPFQQNLGRRLFKGACSRTAFPTNRSKPERLRPISWEVRYGRFGLVLPRLEPERLIQVVVGNRDSTDVLVPGFRTQNL